MGRSVPRNIDRKGEHLSRCDICSTPYLRSALRRGRDGLLRCSDDLPGRDAVTLSELTAQRAAGLAQRLGNISPADGAVPDELPVRVPERPFAPTDISAVSAWLSVAAATSDVNGVSSVPDLINANPAVQSVNARKPVIETSFGLPCLRFATNDVLAWPITAQSAATSYAGWAMWFKPDVVSATMRLMRVSTGTNGASGFGLNMTDAAGAYASNYSTDGDPGHFSQILVSGALDTSWAFLTLEWSLDGSSTATRLTLTKNGSVLTGVASGLVLTTLFAATGNILIGNGADGVASSPLNGLIGPHIYAFNSKMVGATEGVLTPAARLALMQYDNPARAAVTDTAHVPGNTPYTGPTRRYTADQVYNGNVPTRF
jgi:hypothetical protein